jgi:hypothetical protein
MTLDPGEHDRRQEFRRFVRAHHPDRGGDPAVFAAGVEAYRNGARPSVSDRQGSFAHRWPEWVGTGDPRLNTRTSFYRKRNGVAGVLDAVQRGLRRRRQPSRVR